MSIKRILDIARSRTVLLALFLNLILFTVGTIYDHRIYLILSITVPISLYAIFKIIRSKILFPRYFFQAFHRSQESSKRETFAATLSHKSFCKDDWKIQIGNAQSTQPYSSDLINISIPSSYNNALRIENDLITEKPNSSMDSLEPAFRTYSFAGNDLIWQIGLQQQGSGSKNGKQKERLFKQAIARSRVKMLELDLSENSGLDLLSGTLYSEPTTFMILEPESVINYLDNLRDFSYGKPVGIRVSIKKRSEFYRLCNAICKTRLFPDFIIVAGSLNDARLIPSHRHLDQELPLYEAILFVNEALKNYGLEREIKVIAATKFYSEIDILILLALGADAVSLKIPHMKFRNYIRTNDITSLANDQLNADDVHNRIGYSIIQEIYQAGFSNVRDITMSNVFRTLNLLHLKRFDYDDAVVLPKGIANIFSYLGFQSHFQKRSN